MLGQILYIDLEVTAHKKIGEIGLLCGEKELRTASIGEAVDFLQTLSFDAVCGHNIIDFDQVYLQESSLGNVLGDKPVIDTLPISLLLFSQKTFHALPKAYKTEDDFRNNPLEDARLTQKLHSNVVDKLNTLDQNLRNIFYTLCHEERHFKGFFEILKHKPELLTPLRLKGIIKTFFSSMFIDDIWLDEMIEKHPVELAYILSAAVEGIEVHTLPPKVLYDYPQITGFQEKLTISQDVDNDRLLAFSHEVFGFAGFREFPRLDASLEHGTTISQKEIIQAALKQESLIAVLPTGGGKTFSFWLPALYRAKALKRLTVVISPLQALIQDQIESFHKQVANFSAVAISGFQTPPERTDAIEKVQNGEADLLYLAPESLRSNTIFALLKNRVIDRFVIDEAHCLSTWGHDFRHDYFFIAEFIKDLLEEQPWQKTIPVSCFTATAKPDVIEDINRYFNEGLGLDMKRYLARPERKNLHYESIGVEKEDQKYLQLLKILNERQGAALVYIPSSIKRCDEVAEKLSQDLAPRIIKSFHSKLESEEKKEILTAYLQGEVEIIVATTAFGMGVDKPDIQTVIHYEISDSLENYAQEAGRGARDPKLEAHCPILFDEKDLDKHFNTLNRTKLTPREINAIFSVLKNQPGEKVLLSSREIAQKAGWDTEGDDESWDVKVKTALLELEREGYLQRKRNQVRYYADAIAKDAYEKLHQLFDNGVLEETEHQKLTRVLGSLLGRGKPAAYQVDEAALTLTMKKEEIALSILRLKELGIVSDGKDMTLKIKPDATNRVKEIIAVEKALVDWIGEHRNGETTIRALNEFLIESGVIAEGRNVSDVLRKALRGWRALPEIFIAYRIDRQNDLWHYELLDEAQLLKSVAYKHQIQEAIVNYFVKQLPKTRSRQAVELSFSMVELKKALGFPLKSLDRALFHLHTTQIIELASGRFIYYAPMQIYKTDKFQNKLRYTKKEYAKRMQAYYQRKIESIHIMGEYAKRMRHNPKEAAAFLSDYFTMGYDRFKRHYKLLKAEISRPMTKRRYEKIFSKLSEEQREIVEDNEHDAILVLAGPGSGKTTVLVHKIASLILQEDVKPEQFLMLTFSHAAASEFKNRLRELIGELAWDVEIRTFHGYALKTIGRQVSDEQSDLLRYAVAQAADQIEKGVVKPPFKSVLVLDEYQDINSDAFRLIEALYQVHDANLRMIAVGDDDQCILESVNGADVRFFAKFKEHFGGENGTKQYALVHNYRCSPEIVSVSSRLLEPLALRFKETSIKSMKKSEHQPVKIHLCDTPHPGIAAVELMRKEDDYKGTTAYLAFSNEEVSQIYSQLHRYGIEAHYLVERNGYRLRNLAEIFDFTKHLYSQVDNRTFFENRAIRKALNEIHKNYAGSKRLKLLEAVIDGFKKEYEEFYFSLWEEYLNDIQFEEFAQTGKVTVSTMHKSKGREFDRVVVTVSPRTMNDEWLRLLYVAFTRAKEELIIVSSEASLIKLLDPGKLMRLMGKNDLSIIREKGPFPTAKTKTHLMSLKDVVLGYSYYSALDTPRPVSGEQCKLDIKNSLDFYLQSNDGRRIQRLSKSFTNTLRGSYGKGWCIEELEIDSVVYWYDKKHDIWLPHVLCKVVEVLQ